MGEGARFSLSFSESNAILSDLPCRVINVYQCQRSRTVTSHIELQS